MVLDVSLWEKRYWISLYGSPNAIMEPNNSHLELLLRLSSKV